MQAFRLLAIPSSCVALAAVTLAPYASAAPSTKPPYGVNLVVNGDAESNAGAPSDSQVVKPKGWTTTGTFTAVRYGASGGFPTAGSPGPHDRGKNLFEGGNSPMSTATQTIRLDAFASDIDSGRAIATLSAWVGGYAAQADHATVTAVFQSAAGAKLGSLGLPAVTVARRKAVTSSILELKRGTVPAGSRRAVVTIVVTREEGEYDDGSVDDLKLILSKKP